jgi:hypothetical protein
MRICIPRKCEPWNAIALLIIPLLVIAPTAAYAICPNDTIVPDSAFKNPIVFGFLEGKAAGNSPGDVGGDCGVYLYNTAYIQCYDAYNAAHDFYCKQYCNGYP